jgi:hypothetical protein
MSPTPSPEDGNSFSFRNVVNFTVEYLTMDKVQKSSNPEYGSAAFLDVSA